ncbi:endo-1,4-beta-xylanase [Streptomyces cavernae]|uniref:endo-1,4-beta-xylanase n=1 Tax=Streptomyces cavernae TaxID=2259034 RepID=UPI001EE4804C|nr:endo-1,4-beta-xylanase [Streptomyces cavernae]
MRQSPRSRRSVRSRRALLSFGALVSAAAVALPLSSADAATTLRGHADAMRRADRCRRRRRAAQQANPKRFSDLGLEVSITELDVRVQLPASAAELRQQSADHKTASENCLGVPHCAGVTVWGLTDKHSWIPGTFNGYGAALPYDERYASKPAYTGLSNGVNQAA